MTWVEAVRTSRKVVRLDFDVTVAEGREWGGPQRELLGASPDRHGVGRGGCSREWNTARYRTNNAHAEHGCTYRDLQPCRTHRTRPHLLRWTAVADQPISEHIGSPPSVAEFVQASVGSNRRKPIDLSARQLMQRLGPLGRLRIRTAEGPI